MRTMENENLRVQISDHGAELSSIYDKAADREAVWIGDPAFWNRHAPVLFPFVGKVNGGFYTHKGVKYPIGQHGFARDNEFECIENTENKTVHRLVSTEETKKVYPFDFAFTVTQELSGRTLTITWKVENTGDDDMYFSVGGHPAFKKMQEEIDYRKLVVRPKELEAVKEARAQGDLSENFEYKAAKQDKNRNESRIRYLEKMIKTAHVISDDSKDDEVGINNTVQVYIEEDDETETYKLVTTFRGNSLKGYVSIDSPLGKAILGHKVGDCVTVKVSDTYSYDLLIKSIENTADDDDELRSY